MKLSSAQIRKLRKSRSWSQEELAEHSGLSTRTIQRIENDGTASLESQKALATIFDLDPIDIAVSPGDFVDHPAPGTGLMLLLLLGTIGMVLIIPISLRLPAFSDPPWLLPVLIPAAIFCLTVLLWSFWLFDTTYYYLNADGLTVRFGPSTKTYAWQEFETLYWRKGVFTTKIWSPSVTPVVRLSNVVSLQRKHQRWALNLTPNNPQRFIEKIESFAPQLVERLLD